jgi:serine/threonine protein kinase
MSASATSKEASRATIMFTRTELPPRFGRYVIVKKIGEGGMGTVYLAEDTHLDRRVALKVPHFNPDDVPQILERFQREAKVAASIDHSGICPVYDIGAIDGIHYLTMPFIEGVPLSQKLQTDGPLSPDGAVRLVLRLAQTIQTMHQRGVIHRDLKPSNILLRPSGEPVVMDFGLARSSSGLDRLTATGAPVGTPYYMSPEQIMGRQAELGPATDVYSLGVILFELLTGQVPFRGDLHAVYGQILHADPPAPSALRPGLDPRLDMVCRKALAKSGADRYTGMAEFAETLAELPPQDRTAPPPAAGSAAVSSTVQNLGASTLQTGTPARPDAQSVPPTRLTSGGTEAISPSSLPLRRTWRRYLLAGGAVLAVGVILLVLYQQGWIGGPGEKEEDPDERIRSSVTVHAHRDPRQVDTFRGQPRRNYSVWIEGPAEILDRIEKVEYHFDPRQFSPPNPRIGDNRRDGFMHVYVGTGVVDDDMDVVLVFRDGKKITLEFNMHRAIFGK